MLNTLKFPKKKYFFNRSYLRKSRILETSSDGFISNPREIQLNESMMAITYPLYSISPRDILKFAWQISKGMAYLSELKVKHLNKY